MTPYDILGVPSSASPAQIKTAYRKLVRQFHPDLHPANKAAAARFRDINVAYRLLTHPGERCKHGGSTVRPCPARTSRPVNLNNEEKRIGILFRITALSTSVNPRVSQLRFLFMISSMLTLVSFPIGILLSIVFPDASYFAARLMLAYSLLTSSLGIASIVVVD